MALSRKVGVVTLAVCLSTLVAGRLAAQERNLVLNRPYTYHPEARYAHCRDEADATTHLTDGYTSYEAAKMWTRKSTVGWIEGVDVPIVIHFDLGEEATLSELRVSVGGSGGAARMDAGLGLQVYVSLDDRGYVLAGEIPVPPQEQRFLNRQMRVPISAGGRMEKVRARYVALVAKAPPPFYCILCDEVEIMGQAPADPESSLPIASAISASGAKGLQQVLSGGMRASNLMRDLTAAMERHIACWPEDLADAQRKELADFRRRVLADAKTYDALRSDLTKRHCERARQVYGKDTLIWETVPDGRFTMLSLPQMVSVPQSASIHTVVNALEATALGVANLTDKALPLEVSVSGSESAVPKVTPRVARFFVTTNAMYVPDALLAADCPQEIPAGESKLVWLSAESTGARPGAHGYQVTVKVGDDIREIPLDVHVHNVTLPPETPLSTGNWSYLTVGNPLCEAVRDSMLEHRITAGVAHPTAGASPKKDGKGNVLRPVQVDFAEMDRAIEFHKGFPQLGWYLPFDHPDYLARYVGNAEWMSEEFQEICREWIPLIVGRIKASGRDYDAFYFQVLDETLDEKVAQICKLVHSVDPKVRVMITIPRASAAGTKHLVEAGIDIYCHHATTAGIDNDAPPDGYPILSSGGRELWFYAAADARCGSGKERDPLDFYRLTHWLAFRHGATGVHFWNMLNSKTSGWIDETIHETYWPFVYTITERRPAPGDVKTAEKVIPSRRWEYVRMGIEDYMLLVMAKEKIDALGKAGASHQETFDGIVKTVLTNRAGDRNLFRTKRRKLVELVEKLSR